MILEMSASFLITCAVSRSRATSPEATQNDTVIHESYRWLLSSQSLGEGRQNILDDLYSTHDECKEPNWDGQGAAPVLSDTYAWAYRFVEALPIGTPPCTVGVEADGHLTLEWHRSPRRTLSVSVSPTGEFHFASLIGRRPLNGTDFLTDEGPEEILRLIAKVMGQPNEQSGDTRLGNTGAVHNVK